MASLVNWHIHSWLFVQGKLASGNVCQFTRITSTSYRKTYLVCQSENSFAKQKQPRVAVGTESFLQLQCNNIVHYINPFVPTVAFIICCPRDCVSRHNGGTSGAPLKPLRDDSALRALSSLRGLRGTPAVPPLCRETQSLVQQMLNATVGINGLIFKNNNYSKDDTHVHLQNILFYSTKKNCFFFAGKISKIAIKFSCNVVLWVE